MEDKEYEEENKTNSITVSDGFVTLTNYFRYLGSFVSYTLCGGYDVDRILASAYSSMVALNHFWKDSYVDLHSKYLIFLATTINILLWI